MAWMSWLSIFPVCKTDGGPNSLSGSSKDMCKALKDKPPTGKAVVSILVLST